MRLRLSAFVAMGILLSACASHGGSSAAPSTSASSGTQPTATTAVPPSVPGTREVETLACLHAQGLALSSPDAAHLTGGLKALRAQLVGASVATRLAVRACLFTSTESGRSTPGIAAGTTVRPKRDPDEPVFDGDFADPAAIVAGNAVYAFATNTPFANIPVGKSTLRGHAALDGDALPTLPAWTQPGSVWAPSVFALGPNEYRLYYATRDGPAGRQCISVASSATPGGPYTDTSKAPLVCPLNLGGAIDPSTITNGGTTYLLWKNDGNCCGMTTTIWSQALSADGLRVEGTATALIHNDQPWEGDVVEAPAMVEHDGRFFLFYSGNAWDSRRYATGYAICDTVRGPCRKPLDHPWLASDSQISGPGGLSVFAGPLGKTGVIYHAWLGNKIGYNEGGSRALFVASLTWDNDVPVAPH